MAHRTTSSNNLSQLTVACFGESKTQIILIIELWLFKAYTFYIGYYSSANSDCDFTILADVRETQQQ